MGLKICEREELFKTHSQHRQHPHLQPTHSFLEQSGTTSNLTSFGTAERFAFGQNSQIQALHHQQCIQHIEGQQQASHSVSGSHYYAENFPNGEMSFGSLPVLEDDVLSAILEPAPGNNGFENAHLSLHQPDIASKHVLYCQNGPSGGSLSTRQLPIKGIHSTRSVRDTRARTSPYSRENRDQTRSLTGLVTQFPHKDRLEGFDFKVSFPSDSPKLVVSSEGDLKRIHSVNDSSVPIFFNHNAGSEAKVRFLVVFTNDGESTTPVHPCRNHQCSNHPAHILDVTGVSEALWENYPHPSILVSPCETNGSLLSMNLATEKSLQDDTSSGNPNLPYSCAQLKFLCRNSCLTRKDLTLICQLERANEVLARETFLLKVSACPRRDAKAKKGGNIFDDQGGKLKRRKTWESDAGRPLKKFSPSSEEDETDDKSDILETGKFIAMVTESKAVTFLKAMAVAFETLHPLDFSKESRKFERRWKDFLKDGTNS